MIWSTPFVILSALLVDIYYEVNLAIVVALVVQQHSENRFQLEPYYTALRRLDRSYMHVYNSAKARQSETQKQDTFSTFPFANFLTISTKFCVIDLPCYRKSTRMITEITNYVV